MKAVRKTILATSLLAALPGLGHALGLGGINVKSGLNEPLVAEIPVILSSPDEREGLNVGLARPEDFANVGLDYSRVSMPLTFEIASGAKGETVIRVTSQTVVREPFLSLLLEVNWAKGRLLREYSLLLDPPVMASVRRGSTAATQAISEPVAPTVEPLPGAPVVATVADPAPAAAQPLSPPPPPQPEPVRPAPAPVTETPAPPATLAARPERPADPAPAPVVAPPAPAAGEYGPVSKGDNLYSIAQKVRGDGGASMDQWMVSILRANTHAFYQDNINALKTGAILRIPTAGELVSADEARQAVQEHNQLWSGYQARSASSPALMSDAGSSSVAGSRGSAAEVAARLELVAPGTQDGQGGADRPGDRADAGTAQQLRAARDQLALAKEELASAQRESSELGSRVQQLERLQGEQDRLMTLKDDRIADLERRIRELQAASNAPVVATPTPPVESRPVTPDPVPEPVKVDPAPVVATLDGGTDDSGDEGMGTTDVGVDEPAGSEVTREDIWGQSLDQAAASSAAAEPPAEPTVIDAEPTPPSTQVTPVQEPPRTPAEPITPRPVVEEPGFLELYWPWLAGGGGVLVLLGLLAALRKRGSQAAATSEDSVSYTQEPLSDEALGFPAPAPYGGIPTPPPFQAFDADPEMAFRSAIEADPDDLQAHLQLLRLFHQRGDADAYEDAAQAMLARVSNPQYSSEWEEARAMGEQLAPHSGLFARMSDFDTLDLPALDAAPSPATLAAHDDGLGDLDFGSFDAPAPAPAPAVAWAPAPAPAASELDEPAFSFDLDLDAPTRQVEPVPAPESYAAPAPAPAPAQDVSWDFNLDLDSPAPAPAAPVYAAPAPAPAPSFEPPTLDLPDFDFGADIKPVEKMGFAPTEIAGPVIPEPAAADLSAPEIIREPELPSFDDALFSSDDAVGTKLDLARAYLDMGDPDGARSMLEEVMAEGDSVQQSEARELLGRLG